MTTTMIALVGQFQFTEAVLINSVLADHGFHPHPIQPDMQVTAVGGETGYRITVPTDEARDAAVLLAERGFEKFLCG